MFKKSKEQWTSLYGQIDERTKAVVYQGDAYTGRFLQYAILIDIVIRGLKLIEPITSSNFDLLFIVIAGGFISTVFQIKNRVIFNKPYSRGIWFALTIMAISAIIAFVLIRVL